MTIKYFYHNLLFLKKEIVGITKGKIELNENIKEAAIRETYEE